MLDVHLSKQGARLRKCCVYRLIGVEDELAGKIFDIAGKFSVVVYGA